MWARCRRVEGGASENPRQPQAPCPAPSRCPTLHRNREKHPLPLQCPRRERLDGLSDARRARWCTLWPCKWSVAAWRQNKGKRRHAPRYGPAYARGARNRQGAGRFIAGGFRLVCGRLRRFFGQSLLGGVSRSHDHPRDRQSQEGCQAPQAFF